MIRAARARPMNRFLKRQITRLLPRGLVQLAKRRLARSFVDEAVIRHRWTLEEEADRVRCTSDRGWSFLAPLACRDDLRSYVDTPRGQVEFQALTEAGEDGGIIFDVGAHAGMISALFCAANPRNQVHGFEPSPPLVRRQEEISRLNGFEGRMHIHAVAVGDRDHVMPMLIDPIGGYVQTQRFEHTMWAEPETIQVPVETIASAARRLGVVPDWIKLDVEGFELEAILGSKEFLCEHRPRILLEVHLSYLEQRQKSARVLVEALEACGYAFFSYGGQKLRPAQVYDSPLANIHVLVRPA